ncbi:hypothetical protein A3K73_07000 [Candidatus Pacearchaeota archaeon RBG_13_36_9]|nr:MAG: hypothetical protein A3K73_07000 [Candidatus Pacearchaeota archaeon RBG_13_36_9]
MRTARGISRIEAFIIKDPLAQVYSIHSNSSDVSLALTTVLVGAAGWFVGYYGIIKPLIDYFSK